jgi:hypothetical protein
MLDDVGVHPATAPVFDAPLVGTPNVCQVPFLLQYAAPLSASIAIPITSPLVQDVKDDAIFAVP